jgi:large subunit ribosomal protein L24
MKKLQIKTGDEIIVMIGKDKGKKGKVIQTFPKLHRIVVEGLNMAKRHVRTKQKGQPGQIVAFAMPIRSSNVQLISAEGKPMRHNKRPASS